MLSTTEASGMLYVLLARKRAYLVFTGDLELRFWYAVIVGFDIYSSSFLYCVMKLGANAGCGAQYSYQLFCVRNFEIILAVK